MSEEFASTWRQVSDQIGAEFVESKYIFGDAEHGTYYCQLRRRVDKWTITIASYEFYEKTSGGRAGPYYYTRLRAPYIRKDAFDFNMKSTSLPIKLLKFLRFKGVVDYPYIQLGSRVMVVSNDESKLRALFSNPIIYHLFQSVARTKEWKYLGVGPYKELPEGVWALYCLRPKRKNSLMDDFAHLKTLFELFEETLKQMVAIGSASEESPNVVLSHEQPW